MKLRELLIHEDVLVLSLGATLVLMGRHVYHVYDAGLWGGVAAVGLGLATMQFILRGHRILGFLFAGLDATYNLAFFDLLTPTLRGQLDADNASLYLLCFAIPFVLASYAHEYADKGRAAVTSSVQSEDNVTEDEDNLPDNAPDGVQSEDNVTEDEDNLPDNVPDSAGRPVSRKERLALLRRRSAVVPDKLAAEWGVSERTVRRDLAEVGFTPNGDGQWHRG